MAICFQKQELSEGNKDSSHKLHIPQIDVLTGSSDENHTTSSFWLKKMHFACNPHS